MGKMLKMMLAAGLAACLLFAGCGEKPAESTVSSAPEADASAGVSSQPVAASADKVNVLITMEDGGEIALELDPAAAPQTVENFVQLANDGFYDGLTFHRVIPGFMVQGGDPEGTGLGGSGKPIKGEFSSNGWDNPISHKRGVISMARQGHDMDSATSQFFIVHQDSDFLDGDYAAFGQVTSGLEVVDAIAEVATDADDKPVEPVVIQTIRVV